MMKYIFSILIFVGLLNGADLIVKKHKYFANGFNIIADATIKDNTEARIFFKDTKSPKYQLYIKMKCKEDKCYGKLPLASGELLSMDYIVAYKNSAGKLQRSEKVTVVKRDMLFLPKWQNRYYDEEMTLYTEFDPISKLIRGIGNNLDIKPTSEDNIWGIKLNLYKKVKPSDCECEEDNSLESSGIVDSVKNKLGF